MKPRQTPPTIKLFTTLFIIMILACGLLSIDTNVSNAQGQVQVTASDPIAAEQGTINLNVKVTGKGFKNGANAKWLVTGTTDTGGVTVNSTTFVSSTEVTANITVADTASIATFDIQVTNSDGRGGKGTELFKVTAKQAKTAQCPPKQPSPIGDTKCYAAMPGCLDSTFNGVGFIQTHIGDVTRPTVVNDSVVQPDGKLIVIGSAYLTSTSRGFLVTRFNADGSLDTSFGEVDPFNGVLRTGYTITAITTTGDTAYATALQPDGKIVAVGTAGSADSVVVVRYNTNGTFDGAFGNGGKALLKFGKTAGIPYQDIALQSDGKVVVTGGAAGPGGNLLGGFSVARLLPNGSLDSTFGSGGLVVAKPGATALGWSVAIQRVPAVTGEERLVVSGASWASSNANSDWTLMRFNPNGTTDTSFGAAGIVKTPFFGFGDVARRVLIDSANRIVAAGNTRIANASNCGTYVGDYAVARYTANGALDASFSGGKLTIDIYGGMDDLYGLALQPDDKVLLFGYANSSDFTIANYALARLNVDGSRDASFGILGTGITTADFTGYKNYGIAVAVQPSDGKIVVAGSTDPPAAASWDMTVVQYLP